ncbi:DUF983 domain-containing protein [Sphingomonas ginkgonis]|uniref:DUF983 domain-containing protein n=1 Tax=Sphingomonas ginkgonis TaxID=2315330 RepID=A0A429V6L3_9SPHN|nr:DUF983 domain-containing protein [Sphingomonas ginkgonis]RST29573.1 DUF983 domain-containing protein [Sphingomonas ginkgonis]
MADQPPLGTVLRGRCPRCREGRLFAGVVRFAERCSHCGLDFSRYNVGDGPAAFLILVVGAILTGGAVWLELAISPPFWVHAIWIPLGLGLTLGGLRLGKAWLLAQEYVHDAREGRLSP